MSITVSKTFDNEADAAAWLTGKGGSSNASTSNKGSTSSTSNADSKPKHTREQLGAVMDKVKNKGSAEIARSIIAEGVGKSCKLADVPEDKIDAVFDLGTKKIAEIEAAAADEV